MFFDHSVESNVIIGRYLNKEVLKTLLVVLMVLLLLFMGQRFVMYLGDAAQGDYSSYLVLELLLLQLPIFISYLLPLSLFLAVLITLGKLHTDNEMTIISVCGVSDRQVLGYFLPMIMLISLLTGYLTLFQAPAAIKAQQELFKAEKVKGDINLVNAGRFQQTADGKKIIYVEEITEENELRRVFYVAQEDDNTTEFSIIISEKGRYWTDEELRNYLVLENGSQYKGSPGNSKLNAMTFERYFMKLKMKTNRDGNILLKARSTSQLIEDMTSENQAELQWRLSAPLSIPLLLLLALPFSRVPPRQGKFARLLPGLMIYIAYMILLLMMRNKMEAGNISPIIGTWWVHILLLGYALSAFTQWDWLKQLKAKRANPSTNKALS